MYCVAVSIIVTNYNHARYLPLRLESLFKQTFQDFEVILIDDCSTDESLEVFESYANRPDVKVVKNRENSGSPFKQWIKAFSMIKGDIVWIAESDDWCEVDFLKKMMKAFDDGDVQLAYCASKIADENNTILGDYRDGDYLKSISTKRWNKPYCIPAEQEVNEAMGIKNTILNLSAVLFRRKRFGVEFEETIQKMYSGGDTYLILNCMKGGKVYFDATPLNYHRRHSNSIVGKILNDRGDDYLRRFFNDFYVNHIYTARNYRLSPDFKERLEVYLKELWNTLAPGKDYNEIHCYLPFWLGNCACVHSKNDATDDERRF